MKLGVMAAALAAVLLSGAARAQDQVRVGLAAIYPPYGITFAAQELGYYKAKGLDVTLTNFSSGPVAQEALAAGSVDVVTISPPGVAVAVNKGVKERIIAPTGDLTPEGWIMAVPAASPIQTLADLQGKTVGISSKASTTDFLALWAARKGGATIRTIPLGTPGVLPALKAKQIDAAILWPLVSYRATVDGEYRSIADLGKIMDPVLPDTWGASETAIHDKPDALRRWLQANSMAMVYMKKNEAWTIDFLKRYTNEQDPRVLKMTFDTIIQGLRPDGTMDPQWMRNSLDLATDAGIKGLPGPDAIFAPGFTPIQYE